MHPIVTLNLTAIAAPAIPPHKGHQLYSNHDGGFGEVSRSTAAHLRPYGLRAHRLVGEVESSSSSSSSSESSWWERVDRRPERGPASRRSLDSSVFQILKRDHQEKDNDNHGRRGNFLGDIFGFESRTSSDDQLSRLNKEVEDRDSEASTQGDSSRPGNPIPVPSNIDATRFEPNYNVPIEQIEHEFMVLSGGFTDTDWSSFPVWAFDMDLSRNRQWIDLSGLNVGNAANHDEDRTEHLVWPHGRVGHVSSIHDGLLHVFGGLLWKDKEFVVEEAPFIWKAKIGEKLSEVSSSSLQNKSVLEWERIIPKIHNYKDLNKNDAKQENFASCKDTEEEAVQFERTLTRGECRGGHWASGSGLVFYGGLHVQHQLSGHEHEDKEDIALGDVWMYNYTSEALEQLAPYPPPSSQRDENCRYPIARTAHAATIVGDKLYIYGGMTTSAWSPTRGNGDGAWEELNDLWVFDLIERKWSERVMTPSLSRSYHSMVGWGDGSLAVFGGFRTAQTISGEPIAFVFSDTLISEPEKDIDPNLPHRWWKAEYDYEQGGLPRYGEGASNRLEHTASVDKFGNMFIFGGRFKSVSQIRGMWSLNVFGQNSGISLTLAPPDGLEAYEAELEALHMLVAVMMLMSILFTALYGTLRQQAAQHEGGGGGGLGILSRRSGLSREAIDALPTKMYGDSNIDESAQPLEPSPDNVSNTSSLSDVQLEEEECCPICLVEYQQGDELRCLPCKHEFHLTCVDSWLENHTSCPACRHALSNTIPEPAVEDNTTTSDGIWRLDYSMEPLGMTTGLSLSQLFARTDHSGFRRVADPRGQGSENSASSPNANADVFNNEDAEEDSGEAEGSSQRGPFGLRRYLRLPFTPSEEIEDTLGDTELTTIRDNNGS